MYARFQEDGHEYQLEGRVQRTTASKLMRPEPGRKYKRGKVNRWRTRGPVADVTLRKVEGTEAVVRKVVSLQGDDRFRGVPTTRDIL